MDPILVDTHYRIPFDTKRDRSRRKQAAHQAFDVLGRTKAFLLYRFTHTGQWSWAIPGSPIAQQLAATGEAYPQAPVDRLYLVNKS